MIHPTSMTSEEIKGEIANLSDRLVELVEELGSRSRNTAEGQHIAKTLSLKAKEIKYHSLQTMD